MNHDQHLPQIQDESTNLGFVDSDNPLDVPASDLEALPAVTFYQDVDQLLHLEPLTQDAVSLGSFMDQAGMLDMATGSVPQAVDNFTGFDFSASMIGMDSHLDNVDPTLFDPSTSPYSLPDLPSASYEMHPGHASLSVSQDLDPTL
ncbi:hypothetical protein FSARC_8688 [Fusarium sarcochroum]|uniref:Uncharacterized protein n=1 Tax=Fusarium sarcochroum TaxID=1208366 RepID=A0A8H4X6Y7_9HYPO|nr:hypothetical protein FSARC_8688 [Fusarium sarcochroum]